MVLFKKVCNANKSAASKVQQKHRFNLDEFNNAHRQVFNAFMNEDNDIS